MLLKAFHKSPSKRPYYFNRLLFSSVKKSFVYFESNKTKPIQPSESGYLFVCLKFVEAKVSIGKLWYRLPATSMRCHGTNS